MRDRRPAKPASQPDGTNDENATPTTKCDPPVRCVFVARSVRLPALRAGRARVSSLLVSAAPFLCVISVTSVSSVHSAPG